MHRTQLYLDDQLWNALHARARSEKTTISELVREAVRGCYFSAQDQRAKAMQDFVGIRKDLNQELDSVAYIRDLRRSDRLERLRNK